MNKAGEPETKAAELEEEKERREGGRMVEGWWKDGVENGEGRGR